MNVFQEVYIALILESKECGINQFLFWYVVPVLFIYLRKKTTIIVISYSILVAYSILVCAGPLFLTAFGNKGSWCPDHESVRFGQATVSNDDDAVYEEPHYENPDYITDPCFHRRLPQLLFLTLEECDLSRRMLYSVVLGGAIGYERRASDRPAGIRYLLITILFRVRIAALWKSWIFNIYNCSFLYSPFFSCCLLKQDYGTCVLRLVLLHDK